MYQNAIFTTFDSQSFDQSKEGTSLPFQATGGVDPSGCCVHRDPLSFGICTKKIRGGASVSVNGSIEVPAVFALTTQRTVRAAKEGFPSHWGSPPRMQTRDQKPTVVTAWAAARWIQENISRDEIRAQVISGQYSETPMAMGASR